MLWHCPRGFAVTCCYIVRVSIPLKSEVSPGGVRGARLHGSELGGSTSSSILTLHLSSLRRGTFWSLHSHSLRLYFLFTLQPHDWCVWLERTTFNALPDKNECRCDLQ
ncbi:hypothetical protein TRVL_01177 [Trypanosoma vivax]|nr:hypothetical protein TRVL_01177 [Trypanosoma vivax]